MLIALCCHRVHSSCDQPGCIISYHITSYHITSHHITSHHIISYHIISYHIISYLVSYDLSTLPGCCRFLLDESVLHKGAAMHAAWVSTHLKHAVCLYAAPSMRHHGTEQKGSVAYMLHSLLYACSLGEYTSFEWSYLSRATQCAGSGSNAARLLWSFLILMLPGLMLLLTSGAGVPVSCCQEEQQGGALRFHSAMEVWSSNS
jgi:hypothetical protein